MSRGVQLQEPLELAIVVPAFNERENVLPLLQRLEAVLSGVSYETIFVDDDSPDNTSGVVREIGRTDRRVRIIQRVGRRGLASACLEGMLSTTAPYIAVMDADLQHDEAALPAMLTYIRTGEYDLIIGSRNIGDGSMGDFASERVALSNLGLNISKLISKHNLSDPMSGFFMLTRSFFAEAMRGTTGVGFKILLDLVASSPHPVRFAEVPYRFRNRQAGKSKLDLNVGVEYLYLIVDKLIGRWVPTRFVLYCLVGVLGLTVHLGVLWLLFRRLGYSFETALTVAITVALLANYFINNIFTYRERRLRGFKVILGLFIYAIACSIGNLSNYALSKLLLERGVWWPLAGISGLAIGSVWNFAVSSVFTWRPSSRRPGNASSATASGS